jgi:hypothetical protein
LSPFSYEPQQPLPARRRASRRVLLALAGLALLAGAFPATAAASSAQQPATVPTASSAHGAPALDAVVVAPLGVASDADALQALLSAHGVRGRLLYPPEVAVAHVSAAPRLLVAGLARPAPRDRSAR